MPGIYLNRCQVLFIGMLSRISAEVHAGKTTQHRHSSPPLETELSTFWGISAIFPRPKFPSKEMWISVVKNHVLFQGCVVYTVLQL